MFTIDYYITHCAVGVTPSTMRAIIKTESKFNPLAININSKNHLKYHLRYQAHSRQQALAWVGYLERYNYNFDVGLSQVNINTAHYYGYSASDMLDPCLNLHVAALLLQHNYSMARQYTPNKQLALYKALSAYNTGNYYSGLTNGYVAKVIINGDP